MLCPMCFSNPRRHACSDGKLTSDSWLELSDCQDCGIPISPTSSLLYTRIMCCIDAGPINRCNILVKPGKWGTLRGLRARTFNSMQACSAGRPTVCGHGTLAGNCAQVNRSSSSDPDISTSSHHASTSPRLLTLSSDNEWFLTLVRASAGL